MDKMKTKAKLWGQADVFHKLELDGGTQGREK